MEESEFKITSLTAEEITRPESRSSSKSSIAKNVNIDGGNEAWLVRFFRFDHLDRVLDRPQISGIAFSGTIGIGLFITSGELIAISGSLGCVLGFIGAGAIVISVMRSLAEMASVRPLYNALIDYPHTYVDEALGFAVGVTYCLAQCFSMATLTSAAARVANNFYPNKGLSDAQLAGIITGFSVLTVLSNICGVRLYGNIERVVKWIKFLIILSLCALMIVLNAGNVGYPTKNRTANYTETPIVPQYRAGGLYTTDPKHVNDPSYGIPGAGGRFLAVWTSITLAVFACMGGDIVIVAAGEARNPRRDIPAAARFMYLVPISCYVLGSFLVGFNVNFADPDLFRPGSAIAAGYESHSPFIIALKRSILAPHVLPNLYSALFMFSAYTAANTGLFAASRTLFALAKTYGKGSILRTIGGTNAGHTPLTAIFCCAIFSFLSFLGLADKSFNQPILAMSSFFTGSIACVYGAECVAYLRFKKGLSILEEDGLLSRDDGTYRKKHYRAHWQPTFAVFGLIGCTLIMVFTGWPAIYIICARGSLKDGTQLKPNHLLLWDLVGTYAGPILFFSTYIIYKFFIGKTTIRDPESMEFRDSYFVAEIDVLDTENVKVKRGWPRVKHYLLETWSFIK